MPAPQDRLRAYLMRHVGAVVTLNDMRRATEIDEVQRLVRELRVDGLMDIRTFLTNPELRPGEYLYTGRTLRPDEARVSDAWLKCRVFKGMFSDERSVEYTSPNGSSNSFWVPADTVDESAGKVKVRWVRRDSHVWATLPTDYSDSIPVRESDLLSLRL